jgi:methyltransferase-like protein/protein-L-isoaspartate O-methyltransferase
MNPACHGTPYDCIPYPSQSRTQTHPDRLAVLGRLFGLRPAPVEGCRVLELGCGDGANLVPLAYALPQSRFVGVDLASGPIDRARRMAADLGLTNVRFEPMDLAAVPPDWGGFDYIIAHGVLSWVPPAVQSGLLGVCQTQLTDHGIAFVSYDTYPAAHSRDALRTMMRFHVQSFADPAEQIGQARALLRFLAGGCAGDGLSQAWLRHEIESLLQREAGHLFHDDLAESHTPFYFLQFMRDAANHGLRYLAEADFFEMFPPAFDAETQAVLERLGSDRLRREQYLDFLKWRRFRQTLLCRAGAPARADPDPTAVGGFLVTTAARATAMPADLSPGSMVRFETPRSGGIETDLPLGKAALSVLGAQAPEPLTLPELLHRSLDLLRHADLPGHAQTATQEGLAEYLLACYSVGVVEFRTFDPPHATAVPLCPRASAVARWQSRRGAAVTNLRHQPVRLDAAERTLLDRLDGTRDQDALARAAVAAPAAPSGTGPGADSGAPPAVADVEATLRRFARLALLLP